MIESTNFFRGLANLAILKPIAELAGVILGVATLFAAIMFSGGFMFGLGWLLALKALGTLP